MKSLIKKDFRLLLHNRSLMIFSVVIALALVIIICVGIDKKDEKNKDTIVTLGIVNEDKDNSYSKVIVNYFVEDDSFKDMAKFVFTDSEDEMIEKFKNEEVQAYMVVPKGFVDDITHVSSSNIKVRISESNKAATVVLENVLKSYEIFVSSVQNYSVGLEEVLLESKVKKSQADRANRDITISLIQKIMDKNRYFEYEEVEEYKAISIIKYYMYAFMIIFIMYMALHSGIEILKEKGYGVLDRYKSTTNNCFLFIFAKFLCSTFFVSIICELIYIFECIVKNESFSFSVCFMLLMITMFFVAFSICLGFYITKLHTYVLSLNMLFVLISVLGGLIIPLMYLPDNLLSIAKHLPTFKFINTLTMIDNGKSLSDFYFTLLGIIGFITLFLGLATLRYKRGECNE